VPARAGDLGGRAAGVQPERRGRVPQIVGAAGQWGGRQGRAKRSLAGCMPDAAVDRLAEQAATGAEEQPPIQGGAELADVLPEQADQDWRDRDDPDGAGGAVFEPVRLMRPAIAGPSGGGARACTGENHLPAPVRGEGEMALAKRDGFFWAQRPVVQAGEERHQVRPHQGGLSQDGLDLRRTGDRLRADRGGGLGYAPLHLADRVGGQQAEFDRVAEGVVEHRPLAGDGVRCRG